MLLVRWPILLVVAAILCGCGTRKMYPGPELPDANVAVVAGSRTVSGIRIFFRGWDENGQEIQVYKIEVPAGDQQIKIHFTAPSGTSYGAGRTIRFHAQGGHAYKIQGLEWGDEVYIWIEDTYTHEVVGGRKP